MTNDNGKFTWLCAHRDGKPPSFGRNPICGKSATRHEYGMDRCDEHLNDLDPSTWPNNKV